jgi:predicted RNA-binding protein YlqC (UPF0109 family)
MQDLVKYIVQGLVGSPDQVQVTEVRSRHEIDIKIRVAPEDTGRVIGRSGKVAKAIRSLLWVVGTRQGTKVNLEIE